MIPIAVLVVLAGCAPDLRDYDGDGVPDVANGETSTDTSDTGEPPTPTDRIVSTDVGEGVTEVEVDATDGSVWVYFSFDSPEEVVPEDGWAMAFARYHVMTNGGASGAGGVEVVVLEGQDFESLTEAPTEGWIADTADDLAMDAWFDYDSATHYVSAGDRSFALREGDGDYYKVRFLAYYNESGSGGHLRFEWAALAPPALNL